MAQQNKDKNSGLNGMLIGILALLGALAAFLPIILTSIVF